MTRAERGSGGADAIRRELIREGLAAICEEMAVSVIRTSHSETVKSAMDFSTALCDAKGEIIAQGVTLPNQLGALPDAVAAVLREFGGTLVPGDVVMVNDPFAGGMHLPDIFVVKPVFREDRLVAHRGDRGPPRRPRRARCPGSMSPYAEECYQEGLRIPPLRLYAGGVPEHGVFALLRANTRVPGHRPRRHRRPARRLRHRRDRAAAADRAPRRGRLRRPGQAPARLHGGADPARDPDLPRGHLPVHRLPRRRRRPPGPGRDRGRGHDRRRVGDDGLRGLRRRRSRRRSTAPCRSPSRTPTPRCARCSAPTSRTTPASSGRSRSRRRSGSIVNCVLPAATGTRGLTGFRVLDAVFGALAAAVPDRVAGASDGGLSLVTIGGVRPGGERFSVVELLSGAWGGQADHEGQDGVPNLGANVSNIPVEMLEAAVPVRVERYGYVADTGGAGRHRGGLSLEREYTFLGEAVLSVRADRERILPYGIGAGRAGNAVRQRARRRAARSDGCRRSSRGRSSPATGSITGPRAPAAGATRSSASPRRSRPTSGTGSCRAERALAAYGVVVERPTGATLDAAATEAERDARGEPDGPRRRPTRRRRRSTSGPQSPG